MWQARSGAAILSESTLAAGAATQSYVYEGGEANLAEREAAEALFHLYNRIATRGGHILLVGRTPPARWPVALADLRSRLNVLPVAEITGPDDAMLAGLFAKLFRDRQLAVPGEVILYIVQRIERSCAAVARAVEALDRVSLAERRPITLPLARAALGLG